MLCVRLVVLARWRCFPPMDTCNVAAHIISKRTSLQQISGKPLCLSIDHLLQQRQQKPVPVCLLACFALLAARRRRSGRRRKRGTGRRRKDAGVNQSKTPCAVFHHHHHNQHQRKVNRMTRLVSFSRPVDCMHVCMQSRSFGQLRWQVCGCRTLGGTRVIRSHEAEQ